jgi:hypothetical protein
MIPNLIIPVLNRYDLLDNDYERRAVHKNVHIRSVSIPTQHENSSTIGADRGLREKNAVSYPEQRDLLQQQDGEE